MLLLKYFDKYYYSVTRIKLHCEFFRNETLKNKKRMVLKMITNNNSFNNFTSGN
jgi:hypothetical protein